MAREKVLSIEEAAKFDGLQCARLAKLVAKRKARERKLKERLKSKRLRCMFRGARVLVD